MRRMLATKDGRPSLRHLLDSYEREIILAALAAHGGNQRRAAAELGLLPTTLHEKMKRLGLLRRQAVEQTATRTSWGQPTTASA